MQGVIEVVVFTGGRGSAVLSRRLIAHIGEGVRSLFTIFWLRVA